MIDILKSMNILIIDDKEEDLKPLTQIMNLFFKQVYFTNSAIKGLEIYQEKEIHAIFSDYQMPLMSGYELVKEIRQLNKSIPLTIISNHDDKYLLQKFIPLGLSGYIFKPLGFSKVKIYLENFAIDLNKNSILKYKLSDTHFFNLITGVLEINGEIFYLTKLERQFLNMFINNSSNYITKDEIYVNLDAENLTENSIKNLVYRIKKKYNFDRIKNIKNIGYMLLKE